MCAKIVNRNKVRNMFKFFTLFCLHEWVTKKRDIEEAQKLNPLFLGPLPPLYTKSLLMQQCLWMSYIDAGRPWKQYLPQDKQIGHIYPDLLKDDKTRTQYSNGSCWLLLNAPVFRMSPNRRFYMPNDIWGCVSHPNGADDNFWLQSAVCRGAHKRRNVHTRLKSPRASALVQR